MKIIKFLSILFFIVSCSTVENNSEQPTQPPIEDPTNPPTQINYTEFMVNKELTFIKSDKQKAIYEFDDTANSIYIRKYRQPTGGYYPAPYFNERVYLKSQVETDKNKQKDFTYQSSKIGAIFIINVIIDNSHQATIITPDGSQSVWK